ncbi:aminoglycoside phosphotransferase family protein [Thauera sp. SDU_THAU2]|uniref:aminoglycoside phosphotransferase family protein n=1 Tax=Thauera sp. SDU_THAU2 TaxID=3136633 RepID=UPI00311DEF6E
MHCDADAAIAARDTALPGLAVLLDEARLLVLLRGLPELAAASGVVVDYLRYKPGVSCTAGVCVQFQDGAPLRLQLRALTAARYAQAMARPKWQAEIAAGRADAPCMLAGAGIVVLRLRHDRSIRALRLIDDRARLADLLSRLGVCSEDGEAGPVLDILRYKPERRLVARVSSAGRPVAVLRACPKDGFGTMLSNAALAAAVGGPRLLGMWSKRQVFACAWTEGRSLCPEDGSLADAATLRGAGAVLAGIHRSGLAAPLRRERTDEREAVEQAVAALRVLCPEESQVARELAERSLAALSAMPLSPCFIHGDFSIDQVIADAGRLTVIDWDRACQGDPAADLASLCARLDLQVIEGLLTRSQADKAAAACIAGYCEAAGALPAALPWQRVAELLKLLAEPFRKRGRDWPQQLERLLGRARVLAAEAAAAAALPSEVASAGLPTLAQALDAAQMRPHLARCLGLAEDGCELQAVLRRLKPGRRALIEYVVTPSGGAPQSVLGKLRAKGLDRRGYETQRTLWQAGLSRGPVVVPEPLGTVPELALWLQRAVAGQPASGCFAPEAGTGAAWRIGEALALLHRQALRPARAWSIDDELAMLRRCLALAAQARPGLAARIESVARACERLANGLPTAMACGVHRDFYPDQVLVDGETIVLLDFDLHALGDPALDVGNFVAHLIEQSIRCHGDAGALAAHETAFIQAYRAGMADVAAASIAGYTTLSLARHIHLSTRFEDRTHTTMMLLESCEACLAPWSEPSA